MDTHHLQRDVRQSQSPPLTPLPEQGYTFSGWNTQADGGTSYAVGTTVTMPATTFMLSAGLFWWFIVAKRRKRQDNEKITIDVK